MSKLLLSTGAGLTLGLLYTASPLSMWVLAAAAALLVLAGRGLSQSERRLLVTILATGLAARLFVIAGLVVLGLPSHSDLSVGALAGDDAYYLGRALRARDIILGFTEGKYDYFVVTDEYGRTSYLGFLTVIQVIFGPTPFSMRLLNALFFVTGSTLLFRMARQAFGPAPAFAGLVVLLFLPSLLFSSISILKESLYFLCSALLLVCCVRLFKARNVVRAGMLIVIAGASLWLLDDLRRGAVMLAGSGIAVGLALRFVAATRRRLAAAATAVLLAAVVGLSQPPMRARVLDGVVSAAKMHGGHVFTVGHAYKLLDGDFYMNPAAPSSWPLTLTEPQAARFLIRAAVSFLVTPLPWEMRSFGELAYLPEHLLWYLLIAALPAGLVAGWKRDPLVTALIIGYVVPTAGALALTNGNVGTLLRLRGLVTPYLIWVGVLGVLAMVETVLAARRRASESGKNEWMMERPTA
ncbi:MAG: hypothetical protein Q7R30_02335 [Acidobacteriota bacterium]|nr:hypothetical protein [Acidobacteriota bacterium]